ncbi:MAG: diaminopimelate decarboxylase family protein [Candidatus Hodarchaeota archaeon]
MKKISGNPYLQKMENKITIDQVLIEQILEISDLPVMIFLENRIRDNIKNFNYVFKKTFNNYEGFYSFKANFLPEICEIIQSEGLGAELVGILELQLALKMGFPSNKLIVGGPYLSRELIEESIKKNVKEIIVYNLNDLEKINEIAGKLKSIQNICIRINSQKYNSKLGVELNNRTMKKLTHLIDRCKNVKLTTVLSHYTTQMNNIEQYKKNIKVLAHNVKDLIKEGNFIDNINLGGGFPEASIMHKIQLEQIAIQIKNTLDDFDLNYKNIYFEPGRYFVGDAGLYITSITKVTHNRWIFLNIGNNICPKFARCSLRFYNASKINYPHKYKTSIAGIMPTDQDVLAKDYFFTENLDEGDIILITNVGAYTLTFSNRFPYILPKIYLIKSKEIKKIFDPVTDHDFSIKMITN